MGIYYFVNNLKGRKTAKIDVEAGGFLKHKASSKIEDNEKESLRGESYEPIGYGWMFRILKSKYQEPNGAPIARLTRQLGEMGNAITRELEVGVRNPECVGYWICKKRRELESTGSNLASREMYIYFKNCIVAKSRKLREVIERHFISLEFFEELKDPDAEKFHGSSQTT